jgi:hypothetical protein
MWSSVTNTKVTRAKGERVIKGGRTRVRICTSTGITRGKVEPRRIGLKRKLAGITCLLAAAQ